MSVSKDFPGLENLGKKFKDLRALLYAALTLAGSTSAKRCVEHSRSLVQAHNSMHVGHIEMFCH